VYILKMEFHML